MKNKKTNAHLTELEAFKVMVHFLESYYKRTASDDIGSLLGDLQLLQDGGSADPAAWEDWILAVNTVIKGKNQS
jgi:hypothetical protein